MKFSKRLLSAWKVLTGSCEEESEKERENDEVIFLRQNLADLKLELEKAHSDLYATKRDMENVERRMKIIAIQETEARLDLMFAALAAPLSQLRLQRDLMESGKNVSSESVMALARQFASAVENMGLMPIGRAGEIIEFDPHRFSPLSSETIIKPGERAIVRIIGYEREGRIIRKAFVEKKD